MSAALQKTVHGKSSYEFMMAVLQAFFSRSRNVVGSEDVSIP